MSVFTLSEVVFLPAPDYLVNGVAQVGYYSPTSETTVQVQTVSTEVVPAKVPTSGILDLSCVPGNNVIVLNGALTLGATIALPAAFTGNLIVGSAADGIVLFETFRSPYQPDLTTPLSLTGGDGTYSVVIGDRPTTLTITQSAPASRAVMTLGNGANHLTVTGRGESLLTTGTGDDTLLQRGGTVHASLGAGNNLHIYAGGANAEAWVTGNDTIFASTGTDTIAVGETGHAMIHGGGTTLRFLGGTGASTVLGGWGDSSDSGGGNDTLVASWQGSTAANYLQAGWGNTTLTAGTGTTTFGTGLGNAIVQGGAGNDIFWAQSGNATMAGGGGVNQYVFSSAAMTGSGTFVIGDFIAGRDSIELRGYPPASISTAKTEQGSVIVLNDGTRIILNLAPFVPLDSLHFT